MGVRSVPLDVGKRSLGQPTHTGDGAAMEDIQTVLTVHVSAVRLRQTGVEYRVLFLNLKFKVDDARSGRRHSELERAMISILDCDNDKPENESNTCSAYIVQEPVHGQRLNQSSFPSVNIG